MVVYVIVHTTTGLNNEGIVNCSPEVYSNREQAFARLEELFQRCIEIPEMVYDYYKGDSGFMVTYTEGEGVDVFDLYSEKVIEGETL